MNKEELVKLAAKSHSAILEGVDSKLQELEISIYEGQEECVSSVVKRVKEDHSIKWKKSWKRETVQVKPVSGLSLIHI